MNDIKQTTEYILGKVQTEICDARKEISDQKQELDDIKRDLKDIKATLNLARGGWRALIIIGSILATISGIIGAFSSRIFG